MIFHLGKATLPIIMKPEMKLATNAFLVEDIILPKYYSVQFELYMDAPENNDGKSKLILGLTNDLDDTGSVGNRAPSFGIETIAGNLNFVTKMSSGKVKKHETRITSEWFSKWLSFKVMRYLLVRIRHELQKQYWPTTKKWFPV